MAAFGAEWLRSCNVSLRNSGEDDLLCSRTLPAGHQRITDRQHLPAHAIGKPRQGFFNSCGSCS